MTMKRRIQMTRRNISPSRFLRIATLSAGLFLTLAPRFSPLLEAQSTGTATLTVHVIGARNTKGKIRAALFRGAEGFPNDASQAIHTQAADIDPRTSSAQIVFTDLPVGVYAVSVFHAHNINDNLSTNFLGPPTHAHAPPNP